MTAYPFLYFFWTAIITLSIVSSLPADTERPSQGKTNTQLVADQPTTTIQVSAFRERQEAEYEVERLKNHGVDGVIKYETVQGKGKWYRVYVGHFDNENQARTYAQKLKEQDIITWAWVKNLMLPPEAAPAPTATPTKAKTVSEATTAAPNAPVKSSATPNPQPKVVSTESTKSTKDVIPATSASTAPEMTAPQDPQQVLAEKNEPEEQAPPEQESSVRENHKPMLAGDFGFKSQTILRAFQRGTSEGENKLALPLYQYLQLDYGNTEQGGWSMHINGWGRSDLADSTYFEETTDGELLYAYLEYSKPYSALRLNLGRQHIFAGVTNQSVDGLQVTVGLGEILTATLYGGVTAGSEEVSADTTYGGRVALHPQPHYELGLSYQKTDLEGDPDDKAGLDLSLNWSEWLTFQGLSSYNLDSEDWREHSYSATLRYKDFMVEPFYQLFNYQDYFGTGNEESNLFHFLKNSEEQVTIYGAELQWQGSAPVRLGGRYNQYTYELRQEDASYYAVLLNADLPGGSQLGAEAGRMDGESADNTYTLYRAFFYWNNPFNLSESAFISGDGIYQDYDAPVFDEDSAVNFSLSAGWRFFDDRLELTLTGLYSQDPYFDEDVEGILTLRYQH